MTIRLALLIVAAAGTLMLFIAFDAPGCDPTSAPGPTIGGVIGIFGCPKMETAPHG